MPGKHDEKTLEDAVEASLLGLGGWVKGDSKSFDPERGLHRADFFAFVEATQPELWADLKKQHGAGLGDAVLDTLVKSLETRGTLDVLRHGLKFFGKRIDCAAFRPAHGLNPEILAKYAKNRLVVTRQARFIADADAKDCVDLLLLLNGLPIATVELKNHLTGQSVQPAIQQYRARDPRHRLFQFKDRKVFDSVVVITDRRVLDQQLQDNIYQFEHKQGVVEKINEDSEQLAKALASGTPIIITTLQKFPFVTGKIAKLPRRKYAIIVDEAHSSQSGEGAQKMKEVLSAGSLQEAERQDAEAEQVDEEDRLLKVMMSRGRQKNLSFFAFTATPKAKTLEVFGHRDAEGKPRPFHLYSMRQAIEEGFILDVLKSYTTYKAYYRLVKATEDDPRVPKKEATRQLARFMSLHPHNVAQKTEVMVEHFRAKVRHKIGGKAKAMLVTSSRLHALRYKQAFDRYIKEKGYKDVGVLVAFSGKVQDPETGHRFSEPEMNVGKDGKRISEAGLPAAFETDDFQILLAANKYQTGFDQPLLHTMYVDKRLAGVQAVQTLSRLNRTCKGKEDTFVLDFVNDVEEIQRSFQPYYEQTTVSETADPQQLYDLAHKLEAAQVFWESEKEAFCKVFFAPRDKQTVHDQAEMYRHLGPGVDRFKALDEAKQDEFRNALGAFVRLYAFLSQIMPFQDPDLEKLYTFCRYFEMKLPHDATRSPLKLDGEVALKYYRLDKISEGAIQLRAAESVGLRSPVEVGTRKVNEDEAKLSEIIEVLNERFGTEFAKADELLFDQFIEAAKADAEVVRRAMVNPLDNFALAMGQKIEDLMIDRMDQNQDIVTRYLNDQEFRETVFPLLVKKLYEAVRADAGAGR
ncbi:type I restriction endonuclease [Sorangium sp. So ce315]|uniref:type I restriction enzyme subunit R domain-containing protein n=1 Tax=Sorangium sp. So ce315 TaxID=3133299 RepID=UPI003F5E57CD